MGMGKVFIVEASEEQSGAICEALGSHDLQVCRDTHAARSVMADFRPDVLVLGLRDMDGLVFLQELGEDRPGVLVYTAFQGEYIEQHLHKLCDSLMYTPCNLSLLVDRVNDLLCSRQAVAELLGVDPSLDILRQVFHHPARYGYRYIVCAIKLYNRDPMQAVTKELYPAIAREYGTTWKCVEKAIRGAIKQAYQERDDALWRKYFLTDRNGQVICPSNKAFFALITEHIDAKRRKQA